MNEYELRAYIDEEAYKDNECIEFYKTENMKLDNENIQLKMTKLGLTYPNLEIKVATNGEQGGDSGHGGRTYFSILGLDSFDVREVSTLEIGDSLGVEMLVGGDCELDMLIQAFKHMAKELEELRADIKNNEKE